MKEEDWQPGDISNPEKAIQTFCWECLGGETPVEECAAIDCALYPHRLGKAKKKAVREAERARRLSGRAAGPETGKAKASAKTSGLFPEEEIAPPSPGGGLFGLDPEEEAED